LVHLSLPCLYTAAMLQVVTINQSLDSWRVGWYIRLTDADAACIKGAEGYEALLLLLMHKLWMLLTPDSGCPMLRAVSLPWLST